MVNFIGWLKFYFLGFFSNELSQEGASRSFWNVLLSFFLTFLIICGGLVAGYAASFGVHYTNAEGFRGFLYTVFADSNNKERISLSVADGKLAAEIPHGRQNVNSLVEENGAYTVNGYKLILDTRDAACAFDDFILTCKDADGNKITYEDYKAMTEEDKKTVSLAITYSGKSLDTLLKQSDYIAYLEKVSTATDKEYDKDIAGAYGDLKNKEGELGAQKYADEIYKLYIKAYYPVLSGKDAYGEAPTLKTYYLNSKTYSGESKYLILLDDVCICTFKTEGGIAVDYAGNFAGIGDSVITAGGMTSSEMQANIDGLIYKTFNSGSGLNFLVYVVSLFKILPLFVVIAVFIAMVCFLIYKMKRLEFYGKFLGMFKVACAYLLISSLITFIVTLVSAFFLSRGTVYILTGVVLVVILAVRMATLVIMEMVKAKKEKKEAESCNN